MPCTREERPATTTMSQNESCRPLSFLGDMAKRLTREGNEATTRHFGVYTVLTADISIAHLQKIHSRDSTPKQFKALLLIALYLKTEYPLSPTGLPVGRVVEIYQGGSPQSIDIIKPAYSLTPKIYSLLNSQSGVSKPGSAYNEKEG